MAEFNRKALKEIFSAAEIEVPKDVLGQLCDLHMDSSSDMGESIKDLKKQLAKAEQERDDALARAPEEGEETVKKADYDKLKKEFGEYKTGVEKEKTEQQKKTAVREMLKAAGVAENHLDAVLRVYDMNGLELDEKGQAKDAEQRTEAIKKEWSDFIPAQKTGGSKTSNPPGNGGTGLTKDEIIKIKDPAERREAIAKNLSLFEKGNDE